MGILDNILALVKAKKPPVKRSSKWPKVRAVYLEAHPVCEVCGEKKKLEVHHIEPFHNDPSKELDPSNLITLCEVATCGVICHLFFGHLGNYKSFNKNIIEDAKTWKSKLDNKPE